MGVEQVKTDLCVIGGGAAGLSVASAAAMLGVPVVLVERSELGGDCLLSGCIPSKALIAAAEVAETGRTAGDFGVGRLSGHIDGADVMARVRAVIGELAPADSVERFTALGVNVLAGTARFVDGRTVEVAGQRIVARRFVIATGAAPVVPDIPGLADIDYLTSDTIFKLDDLPSRLAIVGGGAIGIELAQAYRRLGVAVTLIEAGHILAREDPDATRLLRQRLQKQGIVLLEDTTIERIQRLASGLTLDVQTPTGPMMLNHGHLLLATGRRPDLDGLNLRAAGVQATDRGITVDRQLRTSNRRIFALGDCIDGPRHTHAATAQAGVVIRNALFRLSATFDPATSPRIVYPTSTSTSLPAWPASGWTRRRRGPSIAMSAPCAGRFRKMTGRISNRQPRGSSKCWWGAGDAFSASRFWGAVPAICSRRGSWRYSRLWGSRRWHSWCRPIRRAAMPRVGQRCSPSPRGCAARGPAGCCDG